MKLLPHESNRNRKLLFKAAEIGLSDLVDRMIRFYQNWRQLAAAQGFDEVLLHLSDI
jgi:hypothetical protein